MNKGRVKHMRKILFFITSLDNGGAEKVLVTLLNVLCKKNYDITVHVIFGGGVYHQKLDKKIHQKCILNYSYKDKRFRHKICAIGLMKLIKYLPKRVLYKLFVHSKYDTEIAFLEGMPTKVISGSQCKNKIAWVHTNPILFPYSSNSYISLQNEKMSYENFTKIYCVSKDVKNAFDKKYKVKSHVLYNMFDNNEICNQSKQIDLKWISKGVKLIVVGRLVQQKGLDRLLKSLGELKREGHCFSLKVLGVGPLDSQLRDLAKKYNITDSIEWEGFQNNPYPYIKAADFLVCSSYTEGYSSVVAEAIILGIPVVTTDCTGMREIFGAHECGIICENTQEGLTKGLKEIFLYPKKREYFVREAKKQAENFDMNRQINEYAKEVFG